MTYTCFANPKLRMAGHLQEVAICMDHTADETKLDAMAECSGTCKDARREIIAATVLPPFPCFSDLLESIRSLFSSSPGSPADAKFCPASRNLKPARRQAWMPLETPSPCHIPWYPRVRRLFSAAGNTEWAH